MFAFVLALAPIAYAEAPLIMNVTSLQSENVCKESSLPSTSTIAYVNNIELYNDPVTNQWLDYLSKCESGNNSQIKILDTNHKHSWGTYQFQAETFISFGKQYDLLPDTVDLTNFEPYIKDPILQRKIAYKMSQDGLRHHWKNCLARYK